jgi:two-component system, cell cycle response regulator
MTHNLDETAHWVSRRPQPKLGVKCAWLTVITGAEVGRVFPLEAGEHLLGRSPDADVQLTDAAISRIHTKLIVGEDGTASVVDCSSKNGTMLGSRAVQGEPISLRDGSKLQIGGAVVVRFSFRDSLEESYERDLYESATRDYLTGAYNKRHFDNQLKREGGTSLRQQRPISVVLFDLDDFKDINDSLGHAAGNHVLKEVAQLVGSQLRSGEILARYGGEEFIVLLPATDLPQAVVVAERLRRELQGCSITWAGTQVEVTASFGVATNQANRTLQIGQLLETVDASLYRAKAAGKNRVCGPGN